MCVCVCFHISGYISQNGKFSQGDEIKQISDEEDSMGPLTMKLQDAERAQGWE